MWDSAPRGGGVVAVSAGTSASLWRRRLKRDESWNASKMKFGIQ
jgi:hypothetical protein